MEKKLVGAVQVNKPFVYHKADYECAAWYEDQEAEVGVYPVYLTKNYHSPHNLILSAEIGAKVKDDYFPSLWAGNPIAGTKLQKRIGESRIIRHGLDVEKAIEATGTIPGSAIDTYIDPIWWNTFLLEAFAELNNTYIYLPQCWSDYLNGDDQYNSKVGQVRYCGREIERWANRILVIKGAMKNEADEYFHRLHVENSKWAAHIVTDKP